MEAEKYLSNMYIWNGKNKNNKRDWFHVVKQLFQYEKNFFQSTQLDFLIKKIGSVCNYFLNLNLSDTHNSLINTAYHFYIL